MYGKYGKVEQVGGGILFLVGEFFFWWVNSFWCGKVLLNKISKWQISLANPSPINFCNDLSQIPWTPSPPSLRTYWMFPQSAYFWYILLFNLYMDRIVEVHCFQLRSKIIEILFCQYISISAHITCQNVSSKLELIFIVISPREWLTIQGCVKFLKISRDFWCCIWPDLV